MTRAGHWTAAVAVGFTTICVVPSLETVGIAAGLVAGANLPDDLEFPLRFGGMRGPTLVPHRSITHWPWFYATILAIALHQSFWGQALVVGACAGALLHLLIDSVSPHGIPWFNPAHSERPSFVVYRTWTVTEWRIVGPLVLIAIVAGMARQHELAGALTNALQTLFTSFTSMRLP